MSPEYEDLRAEIMDHWADQLAYERERERDEREWFGSEPPLTQAERDADLRDAARDEDDPGE